METNKIFVCSDIHGDYNSFNKLLEIAKDYPIIICGDLTPNSQNFANLLASVNNDLFIVKGNCDNAYDFSLCNINIPPRIRDVKFYNKKIVITHGDLYRSPKTSPIKLDSSDIFITGHTHIAKLFIDENKIINLNPGSLSRPRGHFNSSYAIIEENKITIKDLYTNLNLLNLNT